MSFRFINNNKIKQLSRDAIDESAVDVINQNNNILDRRIKQLEDTLETQEKLIKSQAELILTMQEEINEINKINNKTTERATNAKYIKFGEASADTMLLSSVFVDKNDGLIKFKNKNGVLYTFSLT